MKILFFIESLRPGGKERRLVELLKGLSKFENISIELVLTRRDIHYKNIFSLNIKLHYLERKYLKKDPSLFFKFYRIALKFKPDIIHVWGNLAAIYAIPTKILLTTPLINNQITNARLRVKGGLLNCKITFPFSNILIANSKAGLKAYNAPEGKSRVIYNGFDFNRLVDLKSPDTVRKQINISTRHVVGMVATFSLLKDYGTYIKAAQQVLNKNSNITFLCVGAGNDGMYRKLVKPEFINKIRFLDQQQNVESIMNVCDIGVLMTNPDLHREGISNAIMEFMALGRSVIATDDGGTVELIKDGETGFLVKPKSSEKLASKIEYLLDNDKIALRMGINGKNRIEEEFSLAKMVNDYYELYMRLVKKK